MGRRVLVTGALGVVGVWVVRALAERGVELLATDLRSDFGLAPDLAGQVPFAELDVTSSEAVAGAVGRFRPDVVVHLAALMPGETQARPERGFRVNVAATASLLEESRRAGIARFVLASSKGVYGAARGEHGHPTYVPLAEDDACFPASLYDHAKLFLEGLGRAYRETGGPEFVALRFATIYGPGKLARHGPMAFASRLVEEPLAGRSVVLPQGGEQRDELVYVRDVAAGILAAALHDGPTPHDVYNIGSGCLRSVEELAALVRRELPSADIRVGPGLDPMGLGIPYYFLLDGSRAARELGYAPSFDLEAGVRDYVRVVRAGFAPTAASP